MFPGLQVLDGERVRNNHSTGSMVEDMLREHGGSRADAPDPSSFLHPAVVFVLVAKCHACLQERWVDAEAEMRAHEALDPPSQPEEEVAGTSSRPVPFLTVP
jgi:hypothetical protein